MDRRTDRLQISDLPHPGETVVEYLRFNGWSQSELARRTGLTPKTVSEICNGKAPISPATSLALERTFQRPAQLWLGLQRRYDESVARRTAHKNATEWTAWARNFPIKEMKERGWLQSMPGNDDAEKLLSFLGVAQPSNWSALWQSSQVVYRQTKKVATKEEAVAVWVRATELAATEVRTSAYDDEKVRQAIQRFRELTMLRVQDAIKPAQEACALAGIALVFVPELKHTGISGCARWLTKDKALIALTLRYKFDDQMWFTFFHELAHLLLHKSTHAFVLDNAVNDLSDNIVDKQMQRAEEEANLFARDTLIPTEALARFLEGKDFSSEAIYAFAQAVGIGPGIVVGRLQHDGYLQYYQGRDFKQRIHWHTK